MRICLKIENSLTLLVAVCTVVFKYFRQGKFLSFNFHQAIKQSLYQVRSKLQYFFFSELDLFKILKILLSSRI